MTAVSRSRAIKCLDNIIYPPLVVKDFVDNYSFGCSKPNKEKKMIDTKKPFALITQWGETNYFENEADAIDSAKVRAQKNEEDVAIYKMTNVVKFPVPDYEVVAVS